MILRSAFSMALIITLTAPCAIAADGTVEYQNTLAAGAELSYVYVLKFGDRSSDGVVKMSRKPKDEVHCDVELLTPGANGQVSSGRSLRFVYKRVGTGLNCDILAAIKGETVDGQAFRVLAQMIPVAIPLGLVRLGPARFEPLTCRGLDVLPAGDRLQADLFTYNMGSGVPAGLQVMYFWQDDDRGLAEVKYGTPFSCREFISAELQYDAIKMIYSKGKVSYSQKLTRKTDTGAQENVASGWSFSYELKIP